MPSLTDCTAAVGSNDAINFNEGLSTEISSGTKKNDASVVFPDIVIHGTFLSSSLGQPEAVVVQTRLHEEQDQFSWRQQTVKYQIKCGSG